MPATRHITAKNGDVLLLVGTMKGAFLLRSNASRTRWELGGPYFPGQGVYALAYDGREGRRRLWAGTQHFQYGANLVSSDDFGRTWTNPERIRVRFPEDTAQALTRVWQIQPGWADEPRTLYAGVEPAALFRTDDGGESWELVRSLWDHPHRVQWQPGGGGLCLHTIVLDPERRGRMLIAVSTGGVYRSEDGGKSWQVRNQGVRAEFLPNKHPEFGQCVHKVVHHPSRPERLFLQNHWGLYRSDDGADSWTDIANGVPSDFGFGMAMHPHDPDTVYIVPLESDEFRCTPEGKLRVYRTRNAGGSWEPLARGLPQKNALETVLRDALDTDSYDPAGVYFGTRSGRLYGSASGGNAWSLILDGLPAITCVKAAVVGEPRRTRPAGKAKTKPARRAAGRPRTRARSKPRRPSRRATRPKRRR